MIPMSLVGVRVEVPSNQPIVLLRENDGQRYLPIFIGQPEATAIVYALQGTETPRPMTHDLFKSVLDDLGTKVLQVDHHRAARRHVLRRDRVRPRRRHLPDLVPPLRRHRPGRPLRRAGADLRPRGRPRRGRRALRAGRGRGADRAVPGVPRPGPARGLRPRRMRRLRSERGRPGRPCVDGASPGSSLTLP